MSVSTERTKVVIVDPHFEEYLPFSSLKDQHHIFFIPSAKGALRLAREFPDALWIVSDSLPQMSGLDLIEMLQSVLNKATFFLTSEEFDPQVEVRSLCLGISGYHVKPVQAEWLKSWRRTIAYAK